MTKCKHGKSSSRAAFSAAIIAAAPILLFAITVSAGPPDGKGGGGGGDAYALVRLSFPGAAPASTEGFDLNDAGNVVGIYEDANAVQYGFHYSHATRTYSSLGAGVTVAAINDFNELVGTDDVGNRGVYWSSPTAVPTVLPPLPEHTHSRAYGINDAGMIIGGSYIPEDAPVTPEYRAIVVWCVDQAGAVSAPLVLPYPVGDLRGGAQDLTEEDVNGVTLIVGSTGDTESFRNAVQWSVTVNSAGTPQLLTGPTILSSDYASALAVNNSGEVVGDALFSGWTSSWPYLKPMGEPLLPLAGISKASWGSANAINDAGTIVGSQGYLSRGYPVRRAVLWTTPATVVDLNSQVTLDRSESLTMGLSINSRGDILAVTNGSSAATCLLIAR